MSMAKLNPVDGLPEWPARKGVTARQKRLQEKRARRFVMVGWGQLVPALAKLGVARHVRLFFVLLLHVNLQRAQANDGWVSLDCKDLTATGLADGDLYKAVAKLEKLGMVEVQRRPGKRPLLRLADEAELESVEMAPPVERHAVPVRRTATSPKVKDSDSLPAWATPGWLADAVTAPDM